MRISLSLWSLDQARIAEEIKRYEALVDSFHIDVMDGYFADNLLFGPLTVETLRSLTRKPITVHLMITEPARWVSRFVDAGADVLAVHPSACSDFPAALDEIKKTGAAPAAAIGLDEPIEPVLNQLAALSAVLVMGTAIGIKGVPFDEAALATVARLTASRSAAAEPEVFVDGGIRWSSMPMIAAAGAGGVVAGSAITTAGDPSSAAAAIAVL